MFLFYVILYHAVHGGGVYVVSVRGAVLASMWIKMLTRTCRDFVRRTGIGTECAVMDI